MNQLHPIAQAVQSQGRGNDTQLVHMTPNEVQGLQALAMAHGGSLSINPTTGLPEAGFLDSLLPTILGAGLAAATGGSSLMIGAGLGALQYARTGSLEKGLLAGLGAYGGAGLGQGLMGAGAAAAQPAATVATNASPAAMQYQTQALKDAVTPTFTSNLSNMGTGLKSAFSDPSAFVDKFPGGGKDLFKYAGAAAAPTLLQQPQTITPPSDNEQFQYDYDPGRVSEEELARQREENPYGQLTYFRPKYGPRRTVRVAQGGELKYEEGGVAGEYEYDPVTQTYKKKESAPIGAVPAIGVPGSGGDSAQPLSKYTIDFLEKEDKSPGGARDQRMGKINDFIQMLAPGAMARALVGGLNSVTGGSAEKAPAPVFTVDTSGTGVTSSGASDSDNMGGSVTQYSEDPAQTAANQAAAEAGGYPTLAQGGALRYENGGPIGAVEPVGLRGNRPIDANYARDVVGNIAKGYAIEKGLGMLGVSPQLAALGMAGKGIYNFFNPDRPAAPVVSGSDFPSVPGQNPSGDSGGNGGYTVGDGTQGSASMSDYGGEADLAKGGLAGLAAGGMAKGGFVVPADVVSALGNGSTDAGLRTLQAKMGAVEPIKGQGDGLSDSIKTSIDGKQPARVADGEAYIPPATVAKIGGGDPKKGAKKLYAMMDKIRQQAHGKTTQQRKVSPNKVV